MFDSQTLREEIAAIESKMQTHKPVDRSYAIKCVRRLHRLERQEAEQETHGRNAVTGY